MFVKSIARAVATLLAVSAVAVCLGFTPVTAREVSKPAPALWKIDGPNGDIYFFGSIHVLPKGLAWQRPDLSAALVQAQQLVFELDVDEMNNKKRMSLLAMKYGLLEPGESLHKMLAPEHSQRLDTVAKALGLNPADLDRMRPWYVALTLNSLGILKQNSKPGPPVKSPETTTGAAVAGVDIQLWAWAGATGKERGALETTEDQIRAFADMPRKQEIELLILTLEEVKRTSETLATMIEAWKTGDVVRLDKAFNADMDRFPMLRKAVLRDRHEKWLPQIERMIGDGRTHVIVVGTAHLVGKDSVIAMLRAKGVKVEGP